MLFATDRARRRQSQQAWWKSLQWPLAQMTGEYSMAVAPLPNMLRMQCREAALSSILDFYAIGEPLCGPTRSNWHASMLYQTAGKNDGDRLADGRELSRFQRFQLCLHRRPACPDRSRQSGDCSAARNNLSRVSGWAPTRVAQPELIDWAHLSIAQLLASVRALSSFVCPAGRD